MSVLFLCRVFIAWWDLGAVLPRWTRVHLHISCIICCKDGGRVDCDNFFILQSELRVLWFAVETVVNDMFANDSLWAYVAACYKNTNNMDGQRAVQYEMWTDRGDNWDDTNPHFVSVGWIGPYLSIHSSPPLTPAQHYKYKLILNDLVHSVVSHGQQSQLTSDITWQPETDMIGVTALRGRCRQMGLRFLVEFSRRKGEKKTGSHHKITWRFRKQG